MSVEYTGYLRMARDNFNHGRAVATVAHGEFTKVEAHNNQQDRVRENLGEAADLAQEHLRRAQEVVGQMISLCNQGTEIGARAATHSRRAGRATRDAQECADGGRSILEAVLGQQDAAAIAGSASSASRESFADALGVERQSEVGIGDFAKKRATASDLLQRLGNLAEVLTNITPPSQQSASANYAKQGCDSANNSRVAFDQAIEEIDRLA